MKRVLNHNLPNLGFGLAVLTMLVVGGFCALSLRSFIASDEMVNDTVNVLAKLGQTLVLVDDIETGQRGYIITGDQRFLEPYHAANNPGSGINGLLQELRQLTGDNPRQQIYLASLDSLVAKKLAFVQETIGLRDQSGFEAARDAVSSDKGKQMMDSIRQEIAGIQAEETRLLHDRTNRASAGFQSAIVTVLVGGLLSLSFLSLSFFFLRHEVRERRQAEAELLLANAELDSHVGQLAGAKHQIEKQLRRITSLRAIDMAILGATDLRLALKTIVGESIARLQADLVAIFLFNPDTLMLELTTITGNRCPETECTTVRLGDGISGKAALEHRTMAVPDVAAHELSVPSRTIASAEGIQSVYAAPLIAKGHLVGVLNVSFRTPFIAGHDWMEFFDALAGQAAMAVDSGRSFDDLQRSILNLKLAYDTTIEGWSHALDLRDKETEGHTLRVTEMTLKLARRAGMTEAELVHVRRGALLHDIGKMGVPDAILLKPGKLTDEEWIVMRMHPTYAYELISPIAYLHPALDIPFSHHEKWDGSGYPNGLRGPLIPPAARYFAVVDVWDALRSDRPYRKGWPEEKALDHIRAGSGSHFDPKAVEAFFDLINEDSKVAARNGTH